MHVLLLKGGLAKQLTRLHVLAAILAACVHDLEHRGFNNDFICTLVVQRTSTFRRPPCSPRKPWKY